MNPSEAKLLKPGETVWPVRGQWQGCRGEVVKVELGDLRVGGVWIRVRLDDTGTDMLFGGEDLTGVQPKVEAEETPKAPEAVPMPPPLQPDNETKKESRKAKKNRKKNTRRKSQ